MTDSSIQPKPASANGFAFECPITVFKAENAPDGKKRRIAGVISTDSVDRQNEQILQEGLCLKEFVKNGWLNNNHGSAVTDVLGYPESVAQFKAGETLPDGKPAEANCTWVEGYLLDTPTATQIWDLATALAQTKRRLGYSVEGEIQARTGPDGKVIAKAKVRNVAITHCFPGHVRVLAAAQGASRRHYDGPIFDVRLAGGYSVTGTPNHPVLTQRGWVGLGELDKATDVVGCLADGKLFSQPHVLGSGAADKNVKDMPPTLEEIFASSQVLTGIDDVRAGNRHDFHGDGADGDVNIVSAASPLLNRLKTDFFQSVGQVGLAIPEADGLALAASRAARDAGVIVDPPKQRLASLLGSLCNGFWRAICVKASLLRRHVSDYAEFFCDVIHTELTDAVPVRQVATTGATRVSVGNFRVQIGRELLEAAARDACISANFLDLGQADAESGRDVFLSKPAEVKRNGFGLRVFRKLRSVLPGTGLLDGVRHLSSGKFQSASNRRDGDAAAVERDALSLLRCGGDPFAKASMGADQRRDVAGGDAQLAGDDLGGLPSGIHFEKISDLVRREMSGHVYNLQAEPGWYIADGVVVQNCPVNTQSYLEVLARSLTAQKDVLSRSMSLADSTGSDGPVTPNRPYAQGNGQVMSAESLDRRRRLRRRRERTLSRSQAVDYVKSLMPGLSEALARAIVVQAESHPGRGV